MKQRPILEDFRYITARIKSDLSPAEGTLVALAIRRCTQELTKPTTVDSSKTKDLELLVTQLQDKVDALELELADVPKRKPIKPKEG